VKMEISKLQFSNYKQITNSNKQFPNKNQSLSDFVYCILFAPRIHSVLLRGVLT